MNATVAFMVEDICFIVTALSILWYLTSSLIYQRTTCFFFNNISLMKFLQKIKITKNQTDKC